MLRVECLTKIEDLCVISAQWDQLLGQSLHNSYSLSWSWLRHWLSVYLSKDSLLCLIVYDEERIVGIAPLWVKKERQVGIASLKILRFIGSEEVCGDHLDLIVNQKNFEAICGAIWEHLHGPLKTEWDIWEYDFVPSDSKILQALNELSERDVRSLGMSIKGYTICPYATLPESWEQYLATVGTKQRGNLKTSTNLMAQRGKLEFKICESIEDLPRYMASHVDLHNKSWRDRGQSGSFASRDFTEFHRRFSEELLENGQLLLCNLELDGIPVGSFYGFGYNKVLHYYLLGVNREAVPKASIGRVLLGKSIEAAIQRGYREFDMLRGFEEYKYYWTHLERRELLMTFSNRTVGALIYSLRLLTKRLLKNSVAVLFGNKMIVLKHLLGRGAKK